ncbi:MAG: hypothetical protein ACOY31_09955 [Bacillota bacterium]
MKLFKVLLTIAVIFLLMNVSFSETVVGHYGTDKNINHTEEIKETVRGAVEDVEWMSCKSKDEVRSVLARYYEGYLLDDITEKSWDFIKEPTDWYSRAKIVDMAIISDDGEKATVEALIGIEDVDSGHNEVGKGLFTMAKSDKGWRINYTSFSWEEGK